MNEFGIEERMSQDLEILINGVLKSIDGVEAIILYGGYGRGEGAWIHYDNEVKPYNDYDLLVISDSKVNTNLLSDVRKSLARLVGINWVDISVLPRKKLSNLSNSIFNYDLKNGSKVIWGGEHILNEVPDFRAHEVPLQDIRILFFTRAFTLLGSIKDSFFDIGIKEDNVIFFKNQMAKAVLAVVDVKLILNGLYSSSYRERVVRADEEKLFLKEELELVQWALREKLRPGVEPLTGPEALALYGQVTNFFMDNMLVGLTEYYKKPINSAESLMESYKREFNVLLRRMYYFVKRDSKVEFTLACEECQAMTLFSSPYWIHNIPAVSEIKDKLNAQGMGLSSVVSWNEVRRATADLRLKL